MVAVTPNQSDTLKVLRKFLLSVLPVNTPVVLAQVNRVPEPINTNFVLMTPTRRTRIETNIDSASDVFFVGSIAGNVLTVSNIIYGPVLTASQLFGPTVPPGVMIQSQLSGTSGGVGTYQLSASLTIGLGPLASGSKRMLQPTELAVQLDVHGPLSADNAQIISTAFRDEFAYDAMQLLNPNVFPLFADDPKQMVFTNDQSQYEDRWVIDARLQVNCTVIVPQQYADRIALGVISVDAEYPPASNAIGEFEIGVSPI